MNSEELDYSDKVLITITKVKFFGEPSHWEVDITDSSGDELGSGTGPTFAGVYDMAYSMLAGGDKHSDWETNEWTEFNANKKE